MSAYLKATKHTGSEPRVGGKGCSKSFYPVLRPEGPRGGDRQGGATPPTPPRGARVGRGPGRVGRFVMRRASSSSRAWASWARRLSSGARMASRARGRGGGGGNTDIHRACECGGEDPFITRHPLTQGYPWNPMPPTSGMERSQRKRVNNLHEGNSPLSCGGGVVGSPSRNPCLSLRGPAVALRGSGVEDCGDDGRRHRGPRARHLAPS